MSSYMESGPKKDQESQRLSGVNKHLAAATPEEKTAIVLQLITDHPDKRLELSACNGIRPTLDEVNLSPQALTLRDAQTLDSASWWNHEIRGVNLRGAELRGANLRAANLEGADLRGANLEGANLQKARLAGALLEHANLSGADLAGANLRKAVLGEANLQGALLEEADLEDAVLRFSDLRDSTLENATLRGADLWGANLENAVLVAANLCSAILVEANLKGADLGQANLQNARIKKADLQGARLRCANLEGAALGGSNLENAVLREARLPGVDLSDCRITHIHLGGAWLNMTRLAQDQIGGEIGEELSGEYEEAKKGYLSLERNFIELGDHDASSWAYLKKRRMQKKAALAKARAARQKRPRRAAVKWYLTYLNDQFAEWLCDYGESIPRVIMFMSISYILFTLSYYLMDGVVNEQQTGAGVLRTPLSFTEVATYSLISMTTATTPASYVPRNELITLLLGMQALTGIFLTGLLGFVVGNRIRR